MTNDRIRLQFLDDLRAVGMIMVIGVHALGYAPPMPAAQFEVFRLFVHTVSVPVFFLVEGYLLAVRRPTPYAADVRKSARRLLGPWLLFTLAYAAFRLLAERLGLVDDIMLLGRGPRDLLLAGWASLYAPQLYFLVSLFLIRLLTPWLRCYARLQNHAAAVVVFVFVLAGVRGLLTLLTPWLSVPGGQEPLLHAVWGLQYVILGLLCQRAVSAGLNLRVALGLAVVVFATAVVFTERTLLGRMLVQYSYLLLLFLVFAVVPLNSALLRWTGRNTMGLFLVHVPVVMKVATVGLGRLDAGPVTGFVLIVAVSFAMSAVVVAVVNRIPGGSVVWGQTRS